MDEYCQCEGFVFVWNDMSIYHKLTEIYYTRNEAQDQPPKLLCEKGWS